MSAPSKLRSLFSQYYPPEPIFTEAQLAPGSQSGRVFIVTGGNTGIGFELCKLLIRTGATTYMASRFKDKAEAAIKTISDSIPQETPGKGLIKFLRLDLNDFQVVQEAAKEFARQGRDSMTAQDLEPLIGIHCVATLLFSELLRSLLWAAAADNPNPGATRVLWLASNLVETSAPNNGIDFAKLDRGYENRATNYAVSKAGTWMLTREYGRRYAKDGILSLTVNPGNVKAGSYAGTPWPIMAILNATMLHETTYGAYTELYAGLSPDLKPEDYVNYVMPWGRVGAIDVAWRQDVVKAMNPEDEGGLGYGQKLWEWCEEQWKPHTVSSSET
ncbi:NAD(P)-binding protein [Xylaria arbuscula]|nr:NAD(P)-binding protein [Xylaria arbuscula]